jgi:hypothetical protein
MNLTRVRRFSFNIHKYKEKGYSHQKLLDEFVSGWKIDYMVVGQEKTELGIEHLQGYIEFQNATTWQQVKERFESTIGYVSDLQISKGDAESNYKYCSKSNDFVQHGSYNKTLSVDDIAANTISLLQQGIDLIDIMATNKLYAPYIIRNYKNLSQIQNDMSMNFQLEQAENKDLPFYKITK